MAVRLIPNTFTRQSTEYFSEFTPYEFPEGTNGFDLVSDMVSYSVIPRNNPTIINQDVAADTIYSFEVEIKNLTENIALDIEIETDKYFSVEPNRFTLNPLEINKFVAKVNNSEVDVASGPLNFSSSVILRITNRDNKEFAIKRVDVEELEEQFIDETVQIS